MAEKDPGKLADHLEAESDELERRGKELGEEIDDVAQDWERKRADESVPGAPPPSAEEESDENEDGPPPTGAPSGKGEDD